jgi:hypothetical protein
MDIATVLKSNPEVRTRVDNIVTIPRVGELTSVSVLAETNGLNSSETISN